MTDTHPLTAVSVAPDLPESARLAAEVTHLDTFLEEVSIGFHWDMLDRIEDGVYLLDQRRRIVYWSTGAERITGFTAAEVLGRSCRDGILQHVNVEGTCLCADACPLAAVMCDGQPRAADVFLHHRSGHRVPVHVYGAPLRDWQGRIIGAFETFSETTARSHDLERIRELESVAFIDALTGVANRRFYESVLNARFSELHRTGLGFGLILADVDHFKQFNDRYGHETGDAVLKMVAQTLAHGCRPHDLISRYGGEEFAVIAACSPGEGLARLAERLRVLVQASSLTHEGESLAVTISVGATNACADDDPARLFARVDGLMYASKAAGRNRVTTSDSPNA